MIIQAEVSLYPLGQPDLLPEIFAFVERLRGRGLTVETGPLSSLITGESAEVFDGLKEAFEAVEDKMARVLIIKILAPAAQ